MTTSQRSSWPSAPLWSVRLKRVSDQVVPLDKALPGSLWPVEYSANFLLRCSWAQLVIWLAILCPCGTEWNFQRWPPGLTETMHRVAQLWTWQSWCCPYYCWGAWGDPSAHGSWLQEQHKTSLPFISGLTIISFTFLAIFKYIIQYTLLSPCCTPDSQNLFIHLITGTLYSLTNIFPCLHLLVPGNQYSIYVSLAFSDSTY